jgi:four helix bundle protein
LVSGDLGRMMPYERLKAWHASHALVLAIYKETESWPVEERYGMISQARRAVVSVTDNLAEGSARLGGKELRRFADIALGSLAELSNHTRIARDLGFCSQENWARLDELRNQAGKLVYGLARAVGRRKPDP